MFRQMCYLCCGRCRPITRGSLRAKPCSGETKGGRPPNQNHLHQHQHQQQHQHPLPPHCCQNPQSCLLYFWRTLQMSVCCQFLGTAWNLLTGHHHTNGLGWCWDGKTNCLWTVCLLNEPHWQIICWRNGFLLTQQHIKIPQKKLLYIVCFLFMCFLNEILTNKVLPSYLFLSSCGSSESFFAQWDELC